MEAYPEILVSHNLPFVLLSGLELSGDTHADASESSVAAGIGIKITARSPICTGQAAQHLRDEFVKTDGSHRPWNTGDDTEATKALTFKIRTVGRVGMLQLLLTQLRPSTYSTTGLCTPTPKGGSATPVCFRVTTP